MVDGKELFFISDRSISLSYSAKYLKVRSQSEAAGYGIRVLKAGGLGFSYAEDEKDIAKAEVRAAEAVKYSPRPSFAFPPAAKFRKMQLADKKIQQLEIGELKEMFEQVRDGAEKYGGNAQLMMETSAAKTKLENSAGFAGEYDSTSVQFFVEVMDGDGFGFFANAFQQLPTAKQFYAAGEEAAEMACSMKSPKKIESGKYLVAFEPEAFESLFDILAPSFSGEWKKRKISLLHDKVGKQVFSSKLSILDDPLVAKAVNSRPFDDEGVLSAKMPLVENGIVKNFTYNLEIASLEGVQARGNCSRAGYAGQPAIGFSNIVIKPGSMGEEEGDIAIRSFHGSHTANTTTGDFGVEVNAAFITKNGKHEPVRGFMLTGNIFNLFSNIYGIGKKQKNLGGFIAPRIAFSDVQLVG